MRIPVYSGLPTPSESVPPPDSTSNPFGLRTMLMAGIDGMKRKVDPGEPMDIDLFELPQERAASVRTVPGSLDRALDALEADHDYLVRGGVFSEDVLETWIKFKRDKEMDAIRLRPHPYEFFLYFDT